MNSRGNYLTNVTSNSAVTLRETNTSNNVRPDSNVSTADMNGTGSGEEKMPKSLAELAEYLTGRGKNAFTNCTFTFNF